MSNPFEPSAEVILKEIDKVAKRMKEAKLKNDKIGYEIALKEYERLYKDYGHLLYKKKEPIPVFYKRQ